MENNPFSLKNKRILITGASSGIGRAIAVECSKMGACVIITGRNEERLKATILEIGDDKVQYIIANFAKDDDVLALCNKIEDLDGLVNCAGLTKVLPFNFAKPSDFKEVMDVNFFAPAELTRLLLKAGKIRKKGSIVFISSISGVLCSAPAASIYSSSKGAVNGLVKGMALDLAPKGIRVNCVNPGMITTDIFSDGKIMQEQLKEDMKRYPLKRYGKPEEVAYSVIYLLSDASSWVTGSNLIIDGGYTLL
ncbi:SDR family oxidoreductase [Massilibacteroides sp.]|uniref:SDR family NAD(P)-dependent oxidoreductase n=1 Tax=Massilibacteroides sp. TaxID=2034766 RepID=UPI002639161E|nr:SDR family oxidoreductase [Massilibacteroides sp.]MDD4515957.1 SDR family NAD(P)-dependent oxidoreductase [Massilibacteroides sp.]